MAFDATGQLVASYRKIHLFDALGTRESQTVAPGDEVVLADLAGLKVGFLTCYDVRFPELARALTTRGADLIVIPSAWAAGCSKRSTGYSRPGPGNREHDLDRGRRSSPRPRRTPHQSPNRRRPSLLVDPMGTVRLDLGSAAGIAAGIVDTEMTAQVRSVLPSLQHRRPDLFKD